MILTVDIGNSRIKWATWQAGVIVNRGQSEHDVSCASSTFDNLFAGVEKPAEVYAICVAGEEAAQALSQWVEACWQMQVAYLKTGRKYKNIINAYADPVQHGVDRWAGIVAASRDFPEVPLCVISAGTAITFDFIESNGQHLGGYILPSFYSMHKALLADTANVVSTFDVGLQRAIPSNTSDAVNQGLHKFIQSGVRDLCRLAQDTMGQSVQIVLTGGFAKTIQSYPEMPAMCHKPDLVMQGLYDIMRQ